MRAFFFENRPGSAGGPAHPYLNQIHYFEEKAVGTNHGHRPGLPDSAMSPHFVQLTFQMAPIVERSDCKVRGISRSHCSFKETPFKLDFD